ncbi:uncharacterized protein LOC122510909 [Leptopilina heterotoma]|uniref:uncharacterized protein LOC122510909 n=1 Tax=Leptopilina heterotoma TaxID=63436 RepID=UPI001CA7B725|nr:uncharacterized protein LOC122510909 [Leptopilina heterotoma]
MPSSCIVDKCISASLIRKGRKLSLFKPRESTLELWRQIVPTKDNKELLKSHVVCELHFNENDMDKTFKTIINGVQHEMQKEKISLKVGAVPSLLLSNVKDKLDYSQIIKEKQIIALPSKNWSVVRTSEFIVWINWINNNPHTDRRIILYPDMKIKVFVYGNEVKEKDMDVKSVGDLIALFEKLEKFFPCGSSGTCRSENCIGFIIQKEKHERGRKFVLCAACSKFTKKINRQKRESDKLMKVKCKIEKLYKNSKNTHQKCKRLLDKV